ncbi:MAG: sensor histidine kinase [Candidatus Comchoanobacterales bacterium]
MLVKEIPSLIFQAISGIDTENFWMLDEARNLIYANKSLCDYLNKLLVNDVRTYGNFINMNIDQVLDIIGVDDESKQLIRSTDEKILRGESTKNEIVETVFVAGEKRVFKTQKWGVKHQDRCYILGFSMNVTEEYRARGHVQNLLEQVKRAEAAKTRFLRNIKHDLNTPLSNIKGITAILLEQELNDQVHQFVSHLSHSAAHLAQLMDGLLSYTEYKDLQGLVSLEVVDINVVLDQVKEVFRLKADEKKISLKHHYARDKLMFSTDVLKLKRIVSNLLSNAIKYTFKGSVQIGYLCVTVDHQQFLDIFIQDTGIGIAKDQLSVIFEPMHRGVDAEHFPEYGLGLGLDVAKRLTQQLFGIISVESVLNQGSCFTLRLPFQKVELNP